MMDGELIIEALRAREEELRALGILRLSLFGSFARDEVEGEDVIDLAAEFDPSASMDLLQLVALERRLGELLGREVWVTSEPAEHIRLQAAIDRDRSRAF